ncbi:MAG TPA: hypothetical protein VN113_07455 [Caulobacter sp.]|nr:hypothetical protein [Caulobacter sp.]
MKSVALVRLFAGLALAAGLVLAAPVQAAAPITKTTEKVKLQGKKGPSLLKPGFTLGEYEGWSSAKGSTTSLPLFGKNKVSSEIHVSAPGLGPLTVQCGGGESRLGLGWITFKHDPLQYVCAFEGEGAGADAAFALVRSKGSFLARMQQPQRAGELRFGGRTYHVETQQVGDMPIGSGSTIGYVFSRDGQDVGAIDLNGLGYNAYLPAKASGDRDAAAVMALILVYLRDMAD